jgi:hypothetical protein
LLVFAPLPECVQVSDVLDFVDEEAASLFIGEVFEFRRVYYNVNPIRSAQYYIRGVFQVELTEE